MPTLTELAQLGKQALLAVVAQVLTECATLKARIEELLAEVTSLRAENDALKAQLVQRTHARREAPSRSLLQGATQDPAQAPGTQAGAGAFHLPHPAHVRPGD